MALRMYDNEGHWLGEPDDEDLKPLDEDFEDERSRLYSAGQNFRPVARVPQRKEAGG